MLYRFRSKKVNLTIQKILGVLIFMDFKTTSKYGSFFVLVCVFFVAGYGFLDTWWQFFPSTFLMLGISYLFFPKKWKTYLGISVTLKEYVFAFVLCLFSFAVFHILIKTSLPNEYTIGWNKHWGYFSFVNNLFQSLNEELLFRALFLNFLLYLGIKEWKVIIIPSVIFSFLHWLMYAYNLMPESRGVLDYSALCTLLLFGLITGMLFLKKRNILLPWALHAAWNFNRFSLGVIRIDSPEERLPEYISFNLLEGSDLICFLAAFLTIMTWVWYRKKD